MGSSSGRRLRVLLIVNNFSWVIGQIALDLQCVHGSEIDFLYFSTQRLRAAGIDGARELRDLVADSDAVHVLDPYTYKFVDSFPFDKPTLAPIYHVLDWQEEAPNTRSDLVFAISRQWLDDLQARGVDARLLPLGIDTSFWRPSLSPTPTGRQFRVGFFANAGSSVEDRKGTSVLLDALEIVSRRCPQRDVVLVLSGLGWESRREGIEARGIGVDLRGFTSRRGLRRLYRSLHAYAIASSLEGGPSTLLEAMACEIPTVSTPVGIAPELIRPGLNGLVVPIGDPRALADALVEVASNDMHKMAREGRRDVRAWFDRYVSYASVPDLYLEAISRCTRKSGTTTSAIAPERQRAVTELEDRLQQLLIRRHRPFAATDLIGAWRTLSRVDPAAAARFAGRWGKFEAVSRSGWLRERARAR